MTDIKNTTNPAPKYRSPTYRAWESMLDRCRREKCAAYPHYGGRGIAVCESWNIFTNFFADMGEVPEGYTLERDDVNGNYEPSNCRWATKKEQANNRRNGHTLTYNGKTQTIAQWCDELHFTYAVLSSRIYHGWDVATALSTPANPRRHLLTYQGKSQSMAQWARDAGISYAALKTRMQSGWSVERALTEPIRRW